MAAQKKKVPSDPIPSLAHHGHATVLSSAFRSAVRFACLLTGNRFGGYRFNAFRRAAAYHSENGPFARNGFSLARNGSRFRGLHSGVKGPSLLLRYLVNWFRCPFGQSAPLPELVCPNSRRFHASGPLHLRPQTSSGCSPHLHSPPGVFAPSGSTRSMGVAARRSAFRIRPISARSPQPVLFLDLATDHRPRSATFPEACCSSNLLEPSLL
jgi:hypothetical protein